MRVWCFSGANGVGALTNDERGKDLPTDLGPWRPVASLTLGEHEDEREAKRLIEEHGFCCFDEAGEEQAGDSDDIAPG